MLTPVEPRGKSHTMGSIVSFMPRRASARRSPRATDAPASIIIFPGVRYERTAAQPGNRERVDAPRRNEPLPKH